MIGVTAGVRLQDLSVGYGLLRKRQVLDRIALIAPAGQVTAVVGPNGVGKTTLFRVLMGFLEPWSGDVLVHGLRPVENRRRHGVGYLPDAVALPAGYTLLGLLEEGARLSRLHGPEATRAVEAAAGRVGLSGALHRSVREFSKGMARRAALAYALIGSPRLLLLDEPLSGLDPRARAGLRDIITALPEAGITVVLASHDLPEVQRLADVVFVLDRGRVARRLAGRELSGADLERLVLEAEPLA